MIQTFVKKNEYRDSFFLMNLSNDISAWDGIKQAIVIMGTPNNKQILAQLGLLDATAEAATPNDLIIAIELEQSAGFEEFLSRFEQVFSQRQKQNQPGNQYTNLHTALRDNPDTKIVVLSSPGEQAVDFAREALSEGIHVFCFSHHISLEDELQLKMLAVKNDKLMMGPDCGTSIIDGIGYGFANNIRPGSIALVSASGSGLQEVATLIHKSGAGISQAIGVGGRDLIAPIDGLMSVQAVNRIAADASTRCIVLLGKKSSERGRLNVLQAALKTGLPIVTNFLKDNKNAVPSEQIHYAETYEECAMKALEVTGYSWSLSSGEQEAAEWIRHVSLRLKPEQRLVRGLYSGGSLCGEAVSILTDSGLAVRTDPETLDQAAEPSHALIDLGDEQFTEGRPHPFIDARIRSLEIKKAFSDPNVAVILLDVVLGWGCSPDPAGDVAKVVQELSGQNDHSPAVICSICGTSDDFQNYTEQKQKLEGAGVFVAETNAAAARAALNLVTSLKRNV